MHEVHEPARGFRSKRSMEWAGPDLLAIRQRIESRGVRLGTDVTGPYWVFAVVTVRSGSIRYLRGPHEMVPPGRSFAVFMPCWSIVQARLRSCRVSTDAFASGTPLRGDVPSHAVAWPWPRSRSPRSVNEVSQALLAAKPLVSVSVARALSPAPFAERTKRFLDAGYRGSATLADAAARSRTSPAALSRAFKRAYGLPPVEYRHRLRVMDAVYRLAQGGEILEVLADVGFGDASRFYHHFRSILCTPPGSYAARRSRNAKT